MTAARYDYRALSPDGRVVHGFIEAASVHSAKERIADRGLAPLTVAPQSVRERRTRMPPDDVATGMRVLANLVNAGLPITRALRVFETLAPKPWVHAVPSLREHVMQGASLASALDACPLVIPPLLLGIVRAGEAGAGLAAGLEQAAEIAESTASLHVALRAALAYPMVVTAAGIASVGVLVGVVLPRFAAILADFGNQLPASTRIVLGTAHVAHAALLPGIVLIALGAVAWTAWTSTTTGQLIWHRSLLAMPLFGKTRHSAASARLTLSLSALLKSGVPMPQAVTLAARASGDSEIANRAARAKSLVSSGAALSDAFDRERVVTAAAGRLIKSGEETGTLSAMLAHAGAMEREHAERVLRTSVRLIEPLLLLVLAGVVAIIAAALLQAVYSIRPTA